MVLRIVEDQTDDTVRNEYQNGQVKEGSQMQHFKLIYQAFPEELSQAGVNGFTVQKGKNLIILIDSSASSERQDFILKHELSHIVLDHLSKTKPIEQIDSFGDSMFGDGWIEREREADLYAERMTDQELSELLSYQIR